MTASDEEDEARKRRTKSVQQPPIQATVNWQNTQKSQIVATGLKVQNAKSLNKIETPLKTLGIHLWYAESKTLKKKLSYFSSD